MERGSRKCLICGKEYVYCPQCHKGDPKETWKYNYDDQKCRKIFDVISAYAFGHIDKGTAKGRLTSMKIDGMHFTDAVQPQIDDIIGASTKEDIVNE